MAAGKSLDINTKYRMNSGYEIPVYQTPAAEATDLVDRAVRVGYRHVDSARAYRNEKPAATGLLAAGLPRESLFFTSKVAPKRMSYDSARADVDATLAETGLDYVDLYLLHAPYGGREARLGAWKALVEAVEAGKGFIILPKTVTMSRIEENAKVFDFELDAEDMKSLEISVYEPCAWDPTVSRD
ncbi:putative aldo-keto reductase protein [Neofusicoccum parvum UCRNP2]|uniref:Putative aldo-keto reductase protein n=1 Tax=Botryosphaeria parva (strain UCR-NP2) TaxID=1287680 RepID=R1ER87_BOTPV|nr:putative aldo-keto reductase protein [Neofusicoccum parvum UCRNP2]